ncbi:cobalt-precorrin-5B (C(1))-methyltransferase [Varunaivibrio sulfuroxidans]|nr:cobalt-precorrin-5B (C(1))-methyltransferase [Varunaivibrio sulfuroxidans]WES29557.1 cobalt-precorrin-5B (C(1))-methyltransferase [Varunaivibrio sulfuroxidans]
MTTRKPKIKSGSETQPPLRRGWTTGACAAAAAKSAYHALLTGRFLDPVTVALPKGDAPAFPLARAELGDGFARAGIVKDAGDDPDITHGAEIIAAVAPGPRGTGITFAAGPGVGTVTLAGLPLAVGEPAINPAPRKIIAEAIDAVARELNASGLSRVCLLSGAEGIDVRVTVSIPGGEELAQKTMNGRLGVKGGLSILGTTGVVIPYSCASWIHAIHRGVDVARAQGIDTLGAATGKTSETALRALIPLPEAAIIDMGDFAGGLLKYLRKAPVSHLIIAGGFAKMVKLAQGHGDLHSARSRIDFKDLAVLAATAGAARDDCARIERAATAYAVLQDFPELTPNLAALVARRARATALATLSGGVDVDILVIDRTGRLIGDTRRERDRVDG